MYETMDMVAYDKYEEPIGIESSNTNNNGAETLVISITVGVCLIIGIVLGIIVAKKVANK